MKNKIKIRHAQFEDMDAIVTIYNQCIPFNMFTADTKHVKVRDRLNWFFTHPPDKYPIFVAENNGEVAGWISLSAYRPGREALRYTAEVSYFVHNNYQRQGIGSRLLEYTINQAAKLKIKNIFAILLESNTGSIRLLEKFRFDKWGYLPKVANFKGKEVGQFYYGLRIEKWKL